MAAKLKGSAFWDEVVNVLVENTECDVPSFDEIMTCDESTENVKKQVKTISPESSSDSSDSDSQEEDRDSPSSKEHRVKEYNRKEIKEDKLYDRYELDEKELEGATVQEQRDCIKARIKFSDEMENFNPVDESTGNSKSYSRKQSN